MDSATYKEKIREACNQAGTYKACFEEVINTLADILEQKDTTFDKFIKSGGNPIVQHTNKGGATNLVKNPYLVLWNDFNASALQYWRDLGLTPAGLKKINDELVKPTKRNKLAEALDEISKELS